MEKEIYSRKFDLLLSEIGPTSIQITFSEKPYLALSLTPKSRLVSYRSVSITLY